MTTFVQHPIKYLRYAAREKPSYFWSLVLGIAGPVAVIAVPEIRKNYFGYVPPEPSPKSYPLPNRRRNPPAGYEDPE